MDALERLIFRYFDWLDSRSRLFNALLGLVCTALLAVFDIVAPEEVRHSFFYLLPIAFVTWFSGIRYGALVVALCTLLWSLHNIVTDPAITVWNVSSTLLFFSLIAILLSKTRRLWEQQKILACTDPLTGARNLRAFAAQVEHEMYRSVREARPYSLAYIDLDNFKQVNDTCGHAAGDELLKTVVSGISRQLRKTDIVGRLGGDEFALFFPDTDGQSARIVMEKVRQELQQMMQTSAWPITFSIGVLSCAGGVYDFDRLINTADTLMYEVKHSGKNAIRYGTFTGE